MLHLLRTLLVDNFLGAGSLVAGYRIMGGILILLHCQELLVLISSATEVLSMGVDLLETFLSGTGLQIPTCLEEVALLLQIGVLENSMRHRRNSLFFLNLLDLICRSIRESGR
jgi:hypothetical protein